MKTIPNSNSDFRSRFQPSTAMKKMAFHAILLMLCMNAWLGLKAQNWNSTGDMSVSRFYHTTTMLANGKVLVVGGYNNNYEELNSCELYDTASGTWSSTGTLKASRVGHTATLLANGKVLVSAGFTYDSSEIYDPATGTWSTTGPLPGVRFLHTATLLSNGKVLVSGGMDDYYNVLSSCYLYDPSTGTWSSTGSMTDERYYHTATLLPNGKVLVSGGYDDYASMPNLSSCELYDPATGTWSSTGSLMESRYLHTASLLNSGKVLVTGGLGYYNILSSCELYDPSTGTWDSAASLKYERYTHGAAVLSNGTVLAIGGYIKECERYDPSSDSWSDIASLSVERAYHTVNVLPDGKVLVTGGLYNDVYSSCEIYQTSNCLEPSVPSLSASSSEHCGPVSTTLSITSGSLNEATSWKWYTGSCGGTPIDSGTSITLAPAQTTTYYVRGEGGCASAGNCANITITLFPLPECYITGADTIYSSSNYKWYTGPASYNNFWSISGNGTLQGNYSTTVLVYGGTLHNQTLTLTLSAEDENGCKSECSKVVNVMDNTNPTWVKAPQNKTVECD